MSVQPGHIADTKNTIECANCSNTNCLIQKGIPEKQIPIVSNMKKLYEIKKGHKAFAAGQLVEGLFFIQNGKMKIYYKRKKVKQLIRLAGDGDIVGHRGISQQMIYPIDAVALERSLLCFFPIESFFRIRSENRDFDFQTMMFFADELKRSEEEAYNLSKKDYIEKTAYGFLKFMQAFGVDEDHSLKYSPRATELSEIVNLDQENIKNGINLLIEKSIIDSKRSNFKIKNAMALGSVAVNSEFIQSVNE